MKLKRETMQINDPSTTDLLLSDTNGKSIRVHKSLLIDRSGYFADLLSGPDSGPNEIQLDEANLLDLIHYLYDNEDEESGSSAQNYNYEPSEIDFGDIEILMQLLIVARKYRFNQLHDQLISKICWRLRPETALLIYRLAKQLDIRQIYEYSKPLILSWLPNIHKTSVFFELSPEDITELLTSEPADIDRNCKLTALSLWWSHNVNADMTTLWCQLVGVPPDPSLNHPLAM